MSRRQYHLVGCVDNVSPLKYPLINFDATAHIIRSSVIREFCALDMPVFMVSADYNSEHPDGLEDGSGKVVQVTFGELLPYSFGPEHLELPRGGA